MVLNVMDDEDTSSWVLFEGIVVKNSFYLQGTILLALLLTRVPVLVLCAPFCDSMQRLKLKFKIFRAPRGAPRKRSKTPAAITPETQPTIGLPPAPPPPPRSIQ